MIRHYLNKRKTCWLNILCLGFFLLVSYSNALAVLDANSTASDAAKKDEEGEQTQDEADEAIDTDMPSDFSPISLDFKGASLREVIRAISSETQINFILPDRISNQKVYLSLKDVPWDNALRAILEANDLGMIKMKGNVIRIDSLSVLDKEHEDLDAIRKKAALSTPTKVLVVRLSYAKAKSITSIISDMLPSASYDKRVKVQADERTNSVVVEAIPQELSKVRSLIERIDMQTPQVKIESRVIEVLKSSNSFLGINWGMPLNFDQGRGLGFGNLVFPNNFISAFSVDSGAASAARGDGKFDIHVGSLNNVTSLDLRLRMGELTNQTRSLQNNNVLVVDGETANIEAGQEDFFNVPTGNGQTSMSSVKYTLSLNVTPHITADGTVQMMVKIENSAPTTPTKSAATSKSLRTLTTNLMRKSGETAVIGGLYTTTFVEERQGWPYLSQLPIVGILFGSNSKTENRRELIILVTPTIVSFKERTKIALKEKTDKVATPTKDDSEFDLGEEKIQ